MRKSHRDPITPVVGGTYRFPDGQPCKVLAIHNHNMLTIECDGRRYGANANMLTEIEDKQNETTNV